MDYQLDRTGTIFATLLAKRPVILKRGFKNFIDPISPDELAGLAMENEVDSRLATGRAVGRLRTAFESFTT